MYFALLFLLPFVFSTPTSNCPNGLSPHDAEQCQKKLTRLADKLGSLDDKDFFAPRSIRIMKDACMSFQVSTQTFLIYLQFSLRIGIAANSDLHVFWKYDVPDLYSPLAVTDVNLDDNCYTPQNLCSSYDPHVAQKMQSTCEFYDFFTRDTNKNCGEVFENSCEDMMPCVNDLLTVLMNEKANAATVRAAIMSKIECATEEVRLICSGPTANQFRRLVGKQAQQYNL